MSYNFLIIDDSQIVRNAIKKTLGMTTLPVGEVLEAENGRVAIELLRRNWVDLVFLDINMPEMNGMEFMEYIRTDEDLKNTAVVVISTEGSKLRKERLAQLGVKSHIRKPCPPELLTEAVQSILGTS